MTRPHPAEVVRAAWAFESPSLGGVLLRRAIHVQGGNLAIALKAVELERQQLSAEELEAIVQKSADAYESHFSFAQPSQRSVRLQPSKNKADRTARLLDDIAELDL